MLKMDGPLLPVIFYADPTVTTIYEIAHVLPILSSVKMHYPLRKDHPVPTGGKINSVLPGI